MSNKRPELAIRPDRVLKKNAQKVFGKANVTEAYICVPWKEGYEDLIQSDLNQMKFEKDADHLDIDSETVIIVINGNPIKFSASEWCFISKVDMKTTKVLEKKK